MPRKHSHKLGLCGPPILTKLQTLRVILEEACVRCFNLINLMRAEGKETIIKQVNVEASFVSQVWLLQWTKLLQRSIDLTEPLLQWCLSHNGSKWFLYCKIKPNSGNQLPLVGLLCPDNLELVSIVLALTQLLISFTRAENGCWGRVLKTLVDGGAPSSGFTVSRPRITSWYNIIIRLS